MKAIELLAPVKDYTCGCAAIDCGADALYVGPPRFGARVDAGVSLSDIERLCGYAHRFGVRVFATMNTLLYESELREAERLANDVCRAGVDGLIVQDMAFLRMDLPPVELHASTQIFTMTCGTGNSRYGYSNFANTYLGNSATFGSLDPDRGGGEVIGETQAVRIRTLGTNGTTATVLTMRALAASAAIAAGSAPLPPFTGCVVSRLDSNRTCVLPLSHIDEADASSGDLQLSFQDAVNPAFFVAADNTKKIPCTVEYLVGSIPNLGTERNVSINVTSASWTSSTAPALGDNTGYQSGHGSLSRTTDYGNRTISFMGSNEESGVTRVVINNASTPYDRLVLTKTNSGEQIELLKTHATSGATYFDSAIGSPAFFQTYEQLQNFLASQERYQ